MASAVVIVEPSGPGTSGSGAPGAANAARVAANAASPLSLLPSGASPAGETFEQLPSMPTLVSQDASSMLAVLTPPPSSFSPTQPAAVTPPTSRAAPAAQEATAVPQGTEVLAPTALQPAAPGPESGAVTQQSTAAGTAPPPTAPAEAPQESAEQRELAELQGRITAQQAKVASQPNLRLRQRLQAELDKLVAHQKELEATIAAAAAAS
eukprot:m.344482 g.344482  ORF g.344482 m.344482 type:complete len:209 (+) comp19854_c2_seq17:5074-5700(+)